MGYSEVLARLRKENKLTQEQAAGFINRHCGTTYSKATVSNWEKGGAQPSNEHFLLLCELYGVKDIQATFRGLDLGFRSLKRLNELGKSRVQEYITMLCGNPLFAEAEGADYYRGRVRSIRLYDLPVAAGFGEYLDSDSYEEIEADETVPSQADFAVKVSGDSMTPRFVDGQVVFIKEQEALELGEIGIFGLDGDSYIKKLGRGELISLNPIYAPIKLGEFSSLRVFGKVLGG